VVAKQARNVIVQSEAFSNARGEVANTDRFARFVPRADVAAYVARYSEAARAFTERPVGKLAGPVERFNGHSSAMGGTLGNLIADAQLGATIGAGAQIALMNPFGIRAPHQLEPAPDGSLTFGQLYSVQPFNNSLITQTMTGAELKAVLEQGLDNDSPVQLLSPSQGFAYSFDLSRPVGERIVAMSLNGTAVDPAGSYRVTTNSFLANGGDSFSLFARQRDAVIGMPDIDALEAWLNVATPRTVPSETRVTDRTPGQAPVR
jgi:5'-nucleotidase